MHLLKTLSAAACALLALAAIGAATPAQAQQEPHYLAALSELRTARDYIQSDERPQFKGERHHAVDEINKAIAEIKHAAWDDGKQTKYAQSQGAANAWTPMHQAEHFLDGARAHVAQGVDTPANTGLRDRALMHIDEAERTIGNIIHQVGSN
jgi:hypothetical protein